VAEPCRGRNACGWRSTKQPPTGHAHPTLPFSPTPTPRTHPAPPAPRTPPLQILVEADHNGMCLEDITAAIEARGLRAFAGSRAPEASVAGALSRDAIFQKVKPNFWALQPHIQHLQKVEKARAKKEAAASAAAKEAAEKEAAAKEAAAEAEAAAEKAKEEEAAAAAKGAGSSKKEGGEGDRFEGPGRGGRRAERALSA
jgi:hypothetical protein